MLGVTYDFEAKFPHLRINLPASLLAEISFSPFLVLWQFHEWANPRCRRRKENRKGLEWGRGRGTLQCQCQFWLQPRSRTSRMAPTFPERKRRFPISSIVAQCIEQHRNERFVLLVVSEGLCIQTFFHMLVLVYFGAENIVDVGTVFSQINYDYVFIDLIGFGLSRYINLARCQSDHSKPGVIETI